jgi:hypothetical protein
MLMDDEDHPERQNRKSRLSPGAGMFMHYILPSSASTQLYHAV